MKHVAQWLLTHGSLKAVRSFPHCSWSVQSCAGAALEPEPVSLAVSSATRKLAGLNKIRGNLVGFVPIRSACGTGPL